MSAHNSTQVGITTGTTFGEWTVIREPYLAGPEGHRHWRCLCRCSCGCEREVPTRNLKHGTSTRCRKCACAEGLADLTGQKFGKRTVLRRLPGEGRPDRWECRCDCGHVSEVSGRMLRFGRQLSCLGCRKHAYGQVKYDLTGRQFGRWTVLRLEGLGPSRVRLWRCRCACGFEMVRPTNYLTGKDAPGGCRACKDERQKKICYEAAWQRIRAGARNREIDLTLTREYVFTLLDSQRWKCALTGVDIDIARSREGFMHGRGTASLDRIDPAKPYAPGNVHWVHKDVNRMKGSFSQERFIEICRLVARHNSPEG